MNASCVRTPATFRSHTPTTLARTPLTGPANSGASRCGFPHRAEPCRFNTAVTSFPPLIMSPTNGTTNKPWKVFRSSGVSASVFQNTAKTDDGERTFAKVSLSRTYREGNEFKSTTSLGRDDLPIAALLLQQAWLAIVNDEAAKDDK